VTGEKGEAAPEMLLRGQEVGLAKQPRAGYRRGEEGKASLLRGQWGPAEVLLLALGFCLPPSSDLAYCKRGFLGFCLFGIFTQHLAPPGVRGRLLQTRAAPLPCAAVLWQLLLRRNEG